MADPHDPWYRDGLAFSCTRCGHCCTGAPGYVWVDEAEIAALAADRGLGVPDFTRAFVRRVGSDFSLTERPNGDCIFWSREAGCTVYSVRPVQCRTWPFWPDNIATPADWERTTRVCPGSGQGTLYEVDQIRHAAARTPC